MSDEAHRLISRARTPVIPAGYEAWGRARRACGRNLPSRRDLEAAAIDDLLPHALFISVVRDGDYYRFRYSFAGRRVVDLFGGDVTNKYLEHIGHLRIFDDLFRRLSLAVDDTALVYGVSPAPPNGPFLAYEHLTLPLSSDGRSIDTLFGIRCGLPATEAPDEDEIATVPVLQADPAVS